MAFNDAVPARKVFVAKVLALSSDVSAIIGNYLEFAAKSINEVTVAGVRNSVFLRENVNNNGQRGLLFCLAGWGLGKPNPLL